MAWVGYAMPGEVMRIVPQAHAEYDAGYLADRTLRGSADTDVGRGPAGVAVSTGEPTVIADIASASHFLPWLDIAQSR